MPKSTNKRPPEHRVAAQSIFLRCEFRWVSRWTGSFSFGGTLVTSNSGLTFVRGGMLASLLVISMTTADAQQRGGPFGSQQPGPSATRPEPSDHRLAFPSSTAKQRQEVIASLPLARLTPQARHRILSIAQSPTFYRQLPSQAIACDKDMFLFLTRNPDVLVGIWDLLGVTTVQVKRTDPYQLEAEDGSGTTCVVDLVYGDPNLHIFVADGNYDGKMVAKPILGKGVFILRSQYAPDAEGGTTVTSRLDCFVQFDGVGVDLVVRTLSGLIGRSADHNFIETARFMAQISQSAEMNPPAMIDVAERLPQVDPFTKRQFVDVISTVARRKDASLHTASRPLYLPERQ